jgi:amino acid transporter
MAEETKSGLVRVIGRWTLAGLVLNSAIGSGIFGLPSLVSEHVGRAAPLAYLLAAVGVGVIMACFAEVGSQFREAGGPYLYTHEAFGRFAGIQIAWVTWLVRLTAAAANTNLFVTYLSEFWAPASARIPRLLIMTLVLGAPAAINYRGVKSGARMSNFFIIAKLVPLTLFALLGLIFFRTGLPSMFPSFLHWMDAALVQVTSSFSGVPLGSWMDAVLVLVFAYGGFEVALFPMGEAKDPRRDVPFALFVGFVVMVVLYLLIQLGVQAGIGAPETSGRPLADAATRLVGKWGGAFITLGALVSIYGYLGAMMLNAPRLTYALAERQDFPSFFGRIHPRFRTPYISIVVFGVLVWALSLAGSFKWNVTLSAVARLFTYAATCAALIPLRRKNSSHTSFRLPAGKLIAVAGTAFSLVMVTRMDRTALIVIAVTFTLGLANWLWVRGKSRGQAVG